MNIILANSVGIDNNGCYIIHSPSRWTSSVRSRDRWFAYYPWELAYLSSMLKREFGATVKIKLLDACLETLNSKQYIERLASENPDWLILESSTRTYPLNMKIAREVKKRTNCKIVLVGPHATTFPEYVLKDGADYAALGEYEETVVDIIKGIPSASIAGLHPNARRNLIDVKNLPWPEDSDISRLAYGNPGEPSSKYLEIQAYATRGCARNCNFCVCRNVYYGKPNHRVRDPKDVVSELVYLKEKYPSLQGIFFDEESHTQNREFTLKLCSEILANDLQHKLKIEAMCDLSFLDNELLVMMKKAGYYKLRFGIESLDEKVSESIGKPVKREILKDKLAAIKSFGLETYGTFMIGAQGSNKQKDSESVKLMDKLIREGLFDNVQISMATPQPGTPFYEWAAKNSLINTYNWELFDGQVSSVIDYKDYSSSEIKEMFDFAFDCRDHAFFVAHIHNNSLLEWLLTIFSKHGFLKSLRKGAVRLVKESIFCFRKLLTLKG